jgi:hypothetical protein
VANTCLYIKYTYKLTCFFTKYTTLFVKDRQEKTVYNKEEKFYAGYKFNHRSTLVCQRAFFILFFCKCDVYFFANKILKALLREIKRCYVFFFSCICIYSAYFYCFKCFLLIINHIIIIYYIYNEMRFICFYFIILNYIL